MHTTSLAVLMGATLLLSPARVLAGVSDELAPPVRIMAGDQAIDVEIGHAAPFFGDFDGDGKKDLLVGQFGEGKLRIYRNVGGDEAPEFGDFEWFHAGEGLGTVPSG